MKSTDRTDEKLQKVLARSGCGSRREMERAIEQGRVRVNGVQATLGDRVDEDAVVELDFRRIEFQLSGLRPARMLLYNKPEGEICTRKDPEGRPTVYDRLPKVRGERWVAVGRLDFNTSGLLLFTTDGDLANHLMHPSTEIDREYMVRIQGPVDESMKKRLLDGVALDDGQARFTDIVDGAGQGTNRWYYCVVMEGRNREVRRLWESQGVKVSRLKRVRFGPVFIPSHVRAGQWVELTDKEINELCQGIGIDAPQTVPLAGQDKVRYQKQQRKLKAGRGKKAGFVAKRS